MSTTWNRQSYGPGIATLPKDFNETYLLTKRVLGSGAGGNGVVRLIRGVWLLCSCWGPGKLEGSSLDLCSRTQKGWECFKNHPGGIYSSTIPGNRRLFGFNDLSLVSSKIFSIFLDDCSTFAASTRDQKNTTPLFFGIKLDGYPGSRWVCHHF